MRVPVEKQQERCLALMHNIYEGERLTQKLCKLHNMGTRMVMTMKQMNLVDSEGNSLMTNKPNIRTAKNVVKNYKQANKEFNSKKVVKKRKVEISILWGLIKIKK